LEAECLKEKQLPPSFEKLFNYVNIY